MRQINKIIVHCSDSDINSHDDITVIREWHLERGFSDVGYHFYIKKDGGVQKGRELARVGAHCIGHNSSSIGICLGGRHNFTTIQFHALKTLLYDLCREFYLTTNNVYGHRDFSEKSCPNFDVRKV